MILSVLLYKITKTEEKRTDPFRPNASEEFTKSVGSSIYLNPVMEMAKTENISGEVSRMDREDETGSTMCYKEGSNK